jgi:uncharacterized membrane protein YhhN
MLAVILTMLVLVATYMHMRAEVQGPQSDVYFFKPLTTVLTLLIAVQAGLPEGSLYFLAIMAGLVCSLVDDVLLMLPSDRFVAGIVGFLVAHLFHTAGSVSGVGFEFSLWVLSPFLVHCVPILGVLSPHLGRMRLPALAYMATTLVMARQGWERSLRIGQKGALLASLGAVPFVFSDSALAINRFRGQFNSARALSLSTYVAAQ